MMHEFLLDLLIGIIGGIYSSVIVSRVFLLREELQVQLDIIKEEMYHFGSLLAFVDVIEIILKKRAIITLR